MNFSLDLCITAFFKVLVVKGILLKRAIFSLHDH